tara:strand:+ start:137 stop:1084 length:948 start_codon:yes stop_codon:yes gene_type:complete
MQIKNLNPINQNKIYGFKNELTEIFNLYDSKKLPNKIIFSGSKGIGKATMVYHLINYIFSQTEKNPYNKKDFEIDELNKSYNLINKNIHPNFYLVDVFEGKETIEIEQIRKMINYSMKSTFDNNKKIILIDKVENLNLNSVNALLKIIEEPNDNIYFFLIFDSNKQVLSTLKSRCTKFNLSLSFKESIDISNKILNEDVSDLVNSELLYYYSTPGNLVNLINFANTINLNLVEYNLKDFLTHLIDNSYYKSNSYIRKNIFTYIELYFLQLMKISQRRHKINKIYIDTVKKVYNAKRYNLDIESVFIHLKTQLFNE